MNERIKELMLEAGFTNAYADPREGFELVFVDEEHTLESVTKFAQLIVRECMTICKDTAEKQFSPLYNRESDGATVCYKKIKDRFGV